MGEAVEGAAVQVGADGKITYRASGLGSCTKLLIAERMGYDLVDPRGEKALAVMETMKSGHTAEDEVVEKLAEEGVEVNHRNSSIHLAITSKIGVSGHVDGFVGGSVAEIKSMSDDMFRAFWRGDKANLDHGLWPRYQWQISAYMHGSTLSTATVYTYNRDTEEIREFIVGEPFYSFGQIRARVLSIEAAARTYSLPPSCDFPQFPCPAFYLHESDRQEFEDEDDGVIQGLAEAFTKAKGEKEKAEKQYQQTQKALIRAVGETGKFETLQGWKVTTYDPGKGTLDRDKVVAALEASGLDVEEFKQLGVRVTPPKKGEG